MGKGARVKTAVVMPLRSDTQNAFALVVGEPENMGVALGRGWVNTVGAVQGFAPPPTTGLQKMLFGQRTLTLKNDEAEICHDLF